MRGMRPFFSRQKPSLTPIFSRPDIVDEVDESRPAVGGHLTAKARSAAIERRIGFRDIPCGHAVAVEVVGEVALHHPLVAPSQIVQIPTGS